MSANHYPHMHSMNVNRQKADFGYPSNVHTTWPGNQSSEFENREQYMETQLAGEHDNCDSNANQNEILDDEPYPPPGLRRLVTGQTVSFDDGLNSPPFDRIVPGEGNTFSNYPPPPPKAYDSSALSERFISGSMTKDCYPVTQQMFPPIPKKDGNNFNNNLYSDGNVVHNSASQDFFDSYLHDDKSNQPLKNKYTQPFPPYETEKRDNFSRHDHPKPPSNMFDPNNKTANSHFQTGYQPRPPPVQGKRVLKATENIQYDTSFQQRGFQIDQQHETKSQRPYPDEPKYPEPDLKLRNESFDTSAANVPRLESSKNDNSYPSEEVDQPENKEKVPFFQQNDFSADKAKDDHQYRDPSSNRMAVEGASDNIPYTKTVPSSTPMQSPSYDYWYQNNSQSSFVDLPDVKNAPRKEPEAPHSSRFQIEKPHNLETAPAPSHFPSAGTLQSPHSPHVQAQSHFSPVGMTQSAHELHVHSKTPSVSSNTSSVNEILSYQQNENQGNFDGLKKRNEFYGNVDVDVTDRVSTAKAIDNNSLLIARTNEQSAKVTMSRGQEQFLQNGDDLIDSRPRLELNRETLERDEEGGQNCGNEVLANVETTASRNNSTQPSYTSEQRDWQHVGANVAAPAGAEGGQDAGFRKNMTAANQERLIGANRRTVPGGQSTPNEAQTRPFSNSSANASFGYGLQNVTSVDNDEDEREEELAHYTDSGERPVGPRTVVGHNYNTIPGPRKNSAKLGPDPKPNTQYQFEPPHNKSNRKVKPPLEQRLVVGETSSDEPLPSAASRSRNDDRQFDDDKSRRSGKDRGDKSRKKPPYDSRPDRRKIESDDEDYGDSMDRAYDVSPDRGSRIYHEKHYRTSPRRFEKRSSRRDHESSFSQSQGEPYYDDDDDDYETFRNQRRHFERRPLREPEYRQYDQDSYLHDERGYRDRRHDLYGRYDEEPIFRDRTSRPSSRSGSEYHRHELLDYSNPRYYPRPPYYEYLDHRYILRYGGGPHMRKHDIDYWTKVRDVEPKKYMNWFKVTFPKEYAEWYSRYVTQKPLPSTGSYQADRRGSGHSGQSSVNNDSISVNEEKLMSMRGPMRFRPVESETPSVIHETRSTPAKFTTPHVKGTFNALGQLLVVNSCSPLDGQPADVDIYQVSPPDDDPDCVEFMNFTGPFIVGETHVNTVSEFVRYHADTASTSSEKLLYLLIDLIIKLRGVTDGIAISELLMNDYRESQRLYQIGAKEDISKPSSGHPNLSETDILEQYTNLLLEGNKNAALEWAVNYKLWGHAFLLASKMGNKHYSNVLAKFDSSIPMNNPLKTLYQLYSKQIPQAATACSDEKWGDWRPHLAMMLSNPTTDSELDKSAIITLGDSLGGKDVFASHFCYLAAQADFDSKFSLLSLRNNVDHFGVNTSNHAILLTQAYEFAKRLQRKDYTISALLPYKYLLAVRLIDYGKNSIALQYLESIAIDLLKSQSDQNLDLAHNVLELSERIKYSDSKPLIADSVDKPWLTSLRQLVDKSSNESQFTPWNDQHASNETHFSDQPNYQQQSSLTQSTKQLPSVPMLQPQQQIQPQLYSVPAPGDGQQPFSFQMQPPSQQQPLSLPVTAQQKPWDPNSHGPSSLDANSSRGYDQWSINKGQLKGESSLDMNDNVSLHQMNDYQQPLNTDSGNHESNLYSPWDQPSQPTSISMHSSSTHFYSDDGESVPSRDTAARTQKEESSTSQSTNKEAEKKKNDHNSESNGGILNSFKNKLFTSLLPKPKHQMKLPDDTEKFIVYDEQKKIWVDTRENNENNNGANSLKPPPKVSDLPGFQQMPSDQRARLGNAPGGQNIPSAPSGGYKLKGKGMRSNYVNVLSQNTIPTPASNRTANPMMEPYPSAQVPQNMFMPSSVDGNVASFDGSSTSTKLHANASQPRNVNQDMPLFINPAQYNSLG